MTQDQWATTRRLLVLGLGPVIAAANKKLGLDISDQVLALLDFGFVVYVGFSHWKQVQIAKLPTPVESGAAVKPSDPSTVLGP
jgi:hypothetical protein